MLRQLESVERFEDHGKVQADCGHAIDVRSLIYVHLFKEDVEVAVETSCEKCSADLPDYFHGIRVRDR